MPDSFGGWRLILAHHREEEAHHCLRLGSWALCVRCFFLYPVLLALVALEGALGPLRLPHRWFWAFSLVTPAVVDWSRARLYGARGTNIGRGITGALAGLGLGVAFSDYFRDSNQAYFWALMGSLAVVILLVWRSGRGPGPE